MDSVTHAKEGKLQTQLIYPQKNVADLIAEKLAKSKGFEFVVKKVLAGFEVAPADPSKATLKPNTNFYVQAANAAKTMAKFDAAEQAAQDGESVVVTMALKSVGAEWISASHKGKPFWVAKSSLLGWEAGKPSPHSITMKMSIAYAKKRGLV